LVGETVGVAASLLVAYALLPLSGGRRWLGVGVGAMLALSIVPLVVRRARRVLRAERPVPEAVAAVVVTATTALVASAGTYYAMAKGDPGSFRGLGTKIDGIYFAVTVMSSVGFGDITAVGQGARLVTTAHIIFTVALVGLAFRLIGWAVKHNLSRRPDGRRPDGRSDEGRI
jgi:voltage-gated potassium channel